jgi:F-type H+-transporting ATPase subunit a
MMITLPKSKADISGYENRAKHMTIMKARSIQVVDALKTSVFAGAAFVLCTSEVFASGTQVPSVIDYYDLILEKVGLGAEFAPVAAGTFTLLVCLLSGLVFSSKIQKKLDTSDLAPAESFSLFLVLENILEFLYSLSKEQFGTHFRDYMPMISGLFIFILTSNLSGLVPGFPPTTESFSANLVMGLAVFVFYNYAGIKEHGLGYGKQFMGPFLILAPMFIVLELISHAARPLSLSFRLTANIFGDHLLLGVFSGMVPFLVPALLLFFGLLVACIQSFVFTMLSSIYINMAISHDH